MAKAGQIMGPLLSYETLTAFFLEASFRRAVVRLEARFAARALHFDLDGRARHPHLGVLDHGVQQLDADARRLRRARRHFLSGLMVGNHLQSIVPGALRAHADGGLSIHRVRRGYAAAWYLLKNRFIDLAKPMMALALLMIVPLAPLQIVVGDMAGLIVRDHQPAKLAAMEAQWETGVMPLRLFAIPDQTAARNSFEIGVPKLGSLITQQSLDQPQKVCASSCPGSAACGDRVLDFPLDGRHRFRC